MHELKELREMLMEELEKCTQKGELSAGSLEIVDKLTHSIKSIDTIMAMDGYSGDNYSYRRDNMGRYSREGSYRDGSYRGGSYRNSYRGYSREEAKDAMIGQLEDVMHSAGSERTREAIRKAIKQIEAE